MKSNIDENYLISERQRLGAALKAKRESRGFTMQQLADEMGISKTTISKIEAGKWNFGIDTLNSFAVYLEFKLTV